MDRAEAAVKARTKAEAKVEVRAKTEAKVKENGSPPVSTSTSTFPRIYLSPPHMSGREQELVREAFETNWVAPLGPHVEAFEREFAEAISRLEPRMNADEHGAADTDFPAPQSPILTLPLHATALSSGTAALHLALRILAGGRGAGGRGWRMEDGRRRTDEVICSDFTFSASANAITYEGLRPVFIDCDERSWNMDPELLREELADCAKRGKLPRAVIVVDLYGQCADYDPIVNACEEFQVPLIEDAAEALGATYWGTGGNPELRVQSSESRSDEADAGNERDEARGQKPEARSQKSSTMNDGRETKNVRQAGSFGRCAAFSFNGNKVITTGGGGMLASHDKAIAEKARFLATQARDKAPHYQHSEIGFNYRMSNVLAAIGRGQLTVLSERIAARRRNFEFYQRALGDLPGIEFMPEAPYGRSTRWLTCLTIGGEDKVEQDRGQGSGGGGRGTGSPRSAVLGLIAALEAENIEARPLWKPMHLQPVFDDCRVRGGEVSERLFENGLCLPSGSALTEEDLERICAVVRRVLGSGGQ
jgi:pyridoxal phosphate-dependent aminotransferase EpsN